MNISVKVPPEVKTALDKAKQVGYSKYSMCNFVGMPKDFPELHKTLSEYFFHNPDNYLKAVLYDKYHCDDKNNNIVNIQLKAELVGVEEVENQIKALQDKLNALKVNVNF